MFPGMREPERAPEHEYYPNVWSALTRFLVVSVSSAALAMAIRHCEAKTLLVDIV